MATVDTYVVDSLPTGPLPILEASPGPAAMPVPPLEEEHVSLRKLGIGAAIVTASAAIVVGGSALANAAARSAGVPGAAGYGVPGYGTPGNGAPGYGAPGYGGGHGRGSGGSADTPVTGAELTKVTNAMKAKDSAVTVTSVRKDPDGSYDVLGTKAGTQVMFEVSKDLKTITQNTHPGRQGNDPQQQSPTPNA